ncbi:7928_t:CDS:2, partial [Gigaspora margarita]
NSMSTISTFIQKYYPNKADIIWQQLLQYKTRTELASELCKVTFRILNILSSSAVADNYKLTRPKLESKNLIEAVLHFNSRPNNEINKFKLLDPDSDEYEKLVESNSEIETVDLSELEIESATESDMDDE